MLAVGERPCQLDAGASTEERSFSAPVYSLRSTLAIVPL